MHVANWCEANEGHQVGDGECWTLAKFALAKGCGKRAFISSGYTHGALICTIKGIKANIAPEIVEEVPTDSIKRGDILQFTECCFRYPNKALFFGAPHHTSIVLSASDNDSEVEVMHQNVNGKKIVQRESLDLSKLTEGEIKVFRPVNVNWIEELTPMW
ncbi:unnamed protein product [[Candida] boidinii]|nr:unnamed protein product [[Candida] boidinii]